MITPEYELGEKLCSKCGKPGVFKENRNQCVVCRNATRKGRSSEQKLSRRNSEIAQRGQLRKIRLAKEETKYSFFDSWSADSAYALGLIFY
jgi:hypothetical protein